MYVPTMLGVILSYMGYWVDPRNSPARICIGVFANLSINTTATSGGLPKVSYIKAMDIWFFACQIFTFISLIEYAQVNVLLREQKEQDMEAEKAKLSIKVTSLRTIRGHSM